MLSEQIQDPKAYAEAKLALPDKQLGQLWSEFCRMLQRHRQGADRETLPIDLLALCYQALEHQEGVSRQLQSLEQRLARLEKSSVNVEGPR